jgi:signal transduction histidine kinase
MNSLRNSITHILGKRISPTSLQFRLTLELIVLSVLGGTSVTIWAGWRMERTLVSTADQDRLQQVLINLLDNAIKYSVPDRPVDIILEKTKQYAIIHVRDRGIGIALAHQNRIFGRFYRVDDSMTRSRDGTGLGLAIAKSLIEGMNGRISLRSKPGEGSLFTIALPLWKSPL